MRRYVMLIDGIMQPFLDSELLAYHNSDFTDEYMQMLQRIPGLSEIDSFALPLDFDPSIFDVNSEILNILTESPTVKSIISERNLSLFLKTPESIINFGSISISALTSVKSAFDFIDSVSKPSRLMHFRRIISVIYPIFIRCSISEYTSPTFTSYIKYIKKIDASSFILSAIGLRIVVSQVSALISAGLSISLAITEASNLYISLRSSPQFVLRCVSQEFTSMLISALQFVTSAKNQTEKLFASAEICRSLIAVASMFPLAMLQVSWVEVIKYLGRDYNFTTGTLPDHNFLIENPIFITEAAAAECITSLLVSFIYLSWAKDSAEDSSWRIHILSTQAMNGYIYREAFLQSLLNILSLPEYKTQSEEIHRQCDDPSSPIGKFVAKLLRNTFSSLATRIEREYRLATKLFSGGEQSMVSLKTSVVDPSFDFDQGIYELAWMADGMKELSASKIYEKVTSNTFIKFLNKTKEIMMSGELINKPEVSAAFAHFVSSMIQLFYKYSSPDTTLQFYPTFILSVVDHLSVICEPLASCRSTANWLSAIIYSERVKISKAVMSKWFICAATSDVINNHLSLLIPLITIISDALSFQDTDCSFIRLIMPDLSPYMIKLCHSEDEYVHKILFTVQSRLFMHLSPEDAGPIVKGWINFISKNGHSTSNQASRSLQRAMHHILSLTSIPEAKAAFLSHPSMEDMISDLSFFLKPSNIQRSHLVAIYSCEVLMNLCSKSISTDSIQNVKTIQPNSIQAVYRRIAEVIESKESQGIQVFGIRVLRECFSSQYLLGQFVQSKIVIPILFFERKKSLQNEILQAVIEAYKTNQYQAELIFGVRKMQQTEEESELYNNSLWKDLNDVLYNQSAPLKTPGKYIVAGLSQLRRNPAYEIAVNFSVLPFPECLGRAFRVNSEEWDEEIKRETKK